MIQKISSAFIFGVILLFTSSLSAQPTVESGKTLFRNYCATCHDKTMVKDATGPALAGAEERWAEYPREDLYGWIRNSQALIVAGHPRANELWDEWNSVMTAWPNLTDEDIESILLYITDASQPKVALGPSAGVGGEVEKADNSFLYLGLFVLLAILAFILSRFIGSLNEIAAAQDGADFERKTLLQQLTSKKVVSFLIFLFVVNFCNVYKTLSNSSFILYFFGYC